MPSPLNSIMLNEPDYGKQIPTSILMKAYWKALPKSMLYALLLLLAGVLFKTIVLNKYPASSERIYELGIVFEQMLYGLLSGVLFYLASVHIETARKEVLREFTLLQVGLIALRNVKHIKCLLKIPTDSSIHKIGFLNRDQVEDLLKPLRWDEDTVSSERYLFLLKQIHANCYDQFKFDFFPTQEDHSFHPLSKYRSLLRGLGNHAYILKADLTAVDRRGCLKGQTLNGLLLGNSSITIFTLFKAADELAIYLKSEFGYLFLSSPVCQFPKQK